MARAFLSILALLLLLSILGMALPRLDPRVIATVGRHQQSDGFPDGCCPIGGHHINTDQRTDERSRKPFSKDHQNQCDDHIQSPKIIVHLGRGHFGEPDASGRRRPVEIKGSEFTIDCDAIVPAIGQACDLGFVSKDSGISINKWVNFDVDEVTFATSAPGVFAGGDIVTGGATVILAMGAGRKAAAAIDEYLKNPEVW